jgi:AraC family transcriptional regulator
MRSQTRADYHQRMLAVLLHIEAHLDEEIALDRLAAVAHFSPFHFHRIFRAMVGEPVKQYVRRLRLERAARRLKHTAEPVTRVALRAGYDSHEGFTRAFAASFGRPPAQFRRDTTRSARPRRVDVRVESLDPTHVVFMRHVGAYRDVGRTWSALMGWAGARGLIVGRPSLLGIGYDDPEITPAGRVRYDACLVVDGAANCGDGGGVGRRTLTGGDYAVATHRGPYAALGETYAALYGRWLPASGREPAASPAFERYLRSPAGASGARLTTDLYLPLEPR